MTHLIKKLKPTMTNLNDHLCEFKSTQLQLDWRFFTLPHCVESTAVNSKSTLMEQKDHRPKFYWEMKTPCIHYNCSFKVSLICTHFLKQIWLVFNEIYWIYKQNKKHKFYAAFYQLLNSNYWLLVFISVFWVDKSRVERSVLLAVIMTTFPVRCCLNTNGSNYHDVPDQTWSKCQEFGMTDLTIWKILQIHAVASVLDDSGSKGQLWRNGMRWW